MNAAPGPADTASVRFSQARIAQGLAGLSPGSRRRTRAAADQLIDSMQRFADSGRVPLSAVLGEHSTAHAWQHYQAAADATAMDGMPGALHYYYHAHGAPAVPAVEHGHFHLFAQLGADADSVPRFTHLLAIGVDARGLPRRLFTTNRWVTDETWMPAQHVIALAARIAATSGHADGSALRWLRAQLGVFAPQIVELLRHRDRRMNARLECGNRPSLYEDRRMHVISQCTVSVEHQLAAIDRVMH